MTWRKTWGVLIWLVWCAGRVQGAPARPHLLFVVGHMGQPVTEQQCKFVIRNWIRRAAGLKFNSQALQVNKVNLDVPAQKEIATRLGMVSADGISLGLAISDAHNLPDKLIDKAGPFKFDMRQNFHNREFGDVLDAMWALFGKAAHETGRHQPYIGLFVLDPKTMTIEEQAMYQVAKEGAVVFHVTPDSAARSVGLREGDEILAVDGHGIATVRAYGSAVGPKTVGDAVNLTWRRAGKKLEGTLKVREYP
ncbi:MAG TPA: PDZ domain-containing protein [Candidatus Xenobia bacterium]|jgi:S1-C subfamily serine protease